MFATDIDEAKLEALKSEGIAEVARLDARDSAAVAAMAKRAGKTDILLNAAGFVHHGTVLDCSDEDWDFSFDLNVKSMHRTIRAFLPGMLENGRGAIVNISSAAGVFKAAPNRYVYGATKAAVAALTRSVAADFIAKGSAATASAPAPSKRPRCWSARPPLVPTDARCSSPGSRWDGSAPQRKSHRSRSISPATKARSRQASRMSSTAAGRCNAGETPMNKIDLNGRCAVVTGGAQGFGRAIAERFVASGAKVAIWDHDLPFAEKTAKEIGPAVSAFKVDVSDLAAVEKTRDGTLKELGKIDILVNNAGIAGIDKTVWETDLDEWRKVLRINLDGPFICCKAVVPAMIAQKYGRIVNIASIAGKEGNPNAAHYSASKAGLIALTKSLGKELAQHDILVNAVTPAAAKTAIFDQLTQQHIDFMLSKIPKGRFVLVEELAAMVAWLASEDCAFSTGAVFDISGGRATY